MPIYEYRRPDGTTFEIQQSFSDEPLRVDPETGVPVERVLHPPAVHFKGKGFYSTDYGTRKRQRETAAAAEGSSSADSSGGASAEGRSGERESGKPSSGEAAGKSSGGSEAGKRPAKKADGS
ncbi:MAG: zinc ribbon domain-containing protein [Actinobacteria bacterium]|nr:MAG: zinc ribbon domain-containing protein [Actinomycetota bacterium]